ncbi:hypothetical protein V8C34DRAFT_322543 [Trichoderma compactum]
MSSITIQVLRESDRKRWTYGPNYVDGALRLFSVRSLLSCDDATISLSEWRELDWNKAAEAFPQYIAISHSWTPSAEVKLQVQQMGYLYEKAGAVIVMPGGVSAAQAIELEAPWITRAWTLQEATLCPKTYVLGVDGRPKITDEVHWSASRMSPGDFPPIDQVDGELGITEIRDLFHSTYANIRITRFKKDTNEPIDTIQWTVNCLGRAGIWRSIWSRTSKHPQDMVFSIMHLLDVHLEVDFKRDMGDLIVELARRMSALPSWLDIGHDLPFSPQQGLIPVIPRHHPHRTPEKTPCYS